MDTALSATATSSIPERRATITDVAQAAGVSRTAVSCVLSGRDGVRVPAATRQRIEEAAKRVGYRRNALGSALRSGRMDAIGIIAPLNMMISAPGTPGATYFKDMALALSAAAFEAGLNPMLLSEDPSRRISLADLSDRRVDGVVLFTRADVQKLLSEAEASRVPYVTIGSGYGSCQVHTNNFEGGVIATRHLLALGHRRIGYFSYGGYGGPLSAGDQRREGYRYALRDAGIVPQDFLEISGDEIGSASASSLRAILTRDDRPTAMFCFNDEIAVWMIDQCHELGLRVPQDLSVVGFDDNLLAVTARPRLTTVHSPIMELSRAAVQLLQLQIRGEQPPPEPTFISPFLVERDSTCLFTGSATSAPI